MKTQLERKHSECAGAVEQYLSALAFSFVLQSTSANLAFEKGARLRESLRQMGLRDAAYWAATYAIDGLCFGATLACHGA